MGLSPTRFLKRQAHSSSTVNSMKPTNRSGFSVAGLLQWEVRTVSRTEPRLTRTRPVYLGEFGCKGRIRTYDLRLMRTARWPLLYPAMIGWFLLSAQPLPHAFFIFPGIRRLYPAYPPVYRHISTGERAPRKQSHYFKGLFFRRLMHLVLRHRTCTLTPVLAPVCQEKAILCSA